MRLMGFVEAKQDFWGAVMEVLVLLFLYIGVYLYIEIAVFFTG